MINKNMFSVPANDTCQTNAAQLRLAALGRVSGMTAMMAMMAAILLWAPLATAQVCDPFEKQVRALQPDPDNPGQCIADPLGNDWSNADSLATAVDQVAGCGLEYRFILTNCEEFKNCYFTGITDLSLGLGPLDTPNGPDGIPVNYVEVMASPFPLPGGTTHNYPGFLAPGDQVIVDKDTVVTGDLGLGQPDYTFSSLEVAADECIPVNIATESTYLDEDVFVAPQFTEKRTQPDIEGYPKSPETFTDPAYVNCATPEPGISIEKFTNGHDGDSANDLPVAGLGDFSPDGNTVAGVPIGNPITWTYIVTNTGDEPLTDVSVSDSKGVAVDCPMNTLALNESMTCTAGGTAVDLDLDHDVYGCGDGRPTYENMGMVKGNGETSGDPVTDNDLSHYCNVPPPSITIEKFTNGHDGDNANGSPNANAGTFVIGGSTVAEIPENGIITWTYRVTNTGNEPLIGVDVTDSKGVSVSCPMDTLAVNESMDCTAGGFAFDLAAGGSDLPGCGDDRPTYENTGSVVGTGETSGIEIGAADDSHYCNPPPPPECGLTLEKTCALPPPPPAEDASCNGKLAQLTMIWNGADGTDISGVANNAPNGSYVDNGDMVTFFGPFSDNNVVVNVDGGVSTFHVSCSDDDMDGETASNDAQEQVSPLGRDCGKDQGDGKDNDEGINQWLLEGFVDDDGAVLDCNSQPTAGASSCQISTGDANCDTLGKPSSLTFIYTGGGCPGNNSQGSKTDCSGNVDGSQPVTVTLDGGTLGPIAVGGSFIVPSTGSSTVISLSNDGGTQTNDVHTSCSAPIIAGEVFGAMTLVALDGVGNGSDVIYSYIVSNSGGTTVTGIDVSDDQLGAIGSIASLASGVSETLSATVFISEDTINIGSAVGDAGACIADSNPVMVTLVGPPPPPDCDTSITFKELKDDVIKFKLSNADGAGVATMETFLLNFPSEYGAIKEIKLDGAAFKAGDSDTYPDGIGSGVLIGPDDWTEDEIEKLQVDPDETRTLEIKFFEKYKDSATFDLDITFVEECAVDISYTR